MNAPQLWKISAGGSAFARSHGLRRARRDDAYARSLLLAWRPIVEQLEGRILLSGAASPASQASTAPAASFVSADLATQGNWKGNYGVDGFSIASDLTSYPSYAQVSVVGANTYVWGASTSELRALQSSNGGRIASTYYGGSPTGQTGFDVTVNITDGQSHVVAFYLLDWDSSQRSERVQVTDSSSGTVLDTRTASGFNGGEYLVYTVSGRVDFSFDCLSGANAVMSGIFLGVPGASAGNHAPVLGNLSVALPPVNVNDTSSFGSPVSSLLASLGITDPDPGAAQGIAITGSDNTLGSWQFSTDSGSNWNPIGAVSDQSARLLTAAAANRIRFVPTGTAGAATLTVRAWDQSTGANGALADASVNGGSSAFSSSAATASLPVTALSTNLATFLGVDSATAGNWIGQYGSGGYVIANTPPSYPSYAVVNSTPPNSYTWAASTTALRALQTPSGSDRAATTWYGQNLLTDIHVTDGLTHQVALYFTDYDSLARVEQVQILDSSTGAVLDSRTLSNFTNGEYLVYNIAGDVQVSVTLISGMNAVMSALIFGGSLPASSNHAPVLGNPAVSLPPIQENDQSNLGSTVASWVASAGITDQDPGAEYGVAIIGADSHGAWQYSVDGVTWWPLGTPSGASARLLANGPGDRIRFLPAKNYNGPATLTFRAWDRTIGFDGGIADATATGSNTAFSAAAGTATLTVTPVDQAPVLPALGAQSISTGHTLTYVLPAATDVDTPASSLTYSASNLPSGAMFDPATRTLTWIPTSIPSGGGIPLALDSTPISLTGWNYDAISENSATPYAQPFEGTDVGSVSFFESGLGGYYDGLPVGGGPFTSKVVNSVTGGHTIFQFQPYTSNNALILKDYERNTRAMYLTTPAQYRSIAILAASNHVQPFVGANVGLVRLVYYINGNSGPTASTDGNFPLPSGLDGDPNRNNATHYNASTWFTNFIYTDGSGQAPSAVGNIAYNANITANGTGFQHSTDQPVGMYESDESLVNGFRVNGVITDLSSKYIKAIYFRKADSAPGGTTGIFAVSGVPNNTTPPGTSDVVFTVSDGQLTYSQTLRINVADGSVNPPLALAPVPDQSAMVLTPLSFALQTTGTAAGLVSISAANVPPGATFDPASHVFNWTPGQSQAPGLYTATFTATDGTQTASETVNINLLTVTPAPVVTDHIYTVAANTELDVPAATGVLVNASDPEGLPILAAVATWPAHAASFHVNDDGSFSYVPVAGFNGIDQFSFVADNERGTNPSSDPGTVTIGVGNITPQPPVAQPDAASTFRNGALTISAAALLANDSQSAFDGPGQVLSISAVTSTAGTNGTVQLNADGSVTYTPTPGFVGTANFTYTLQDSGSIFGQPFVTTATATVTVQVIDRPPVASAGGDQTANAGSSVSFSAAGSSDPDGDPLLYAWTFGDGATASGVGVSHVYADPGVYKVLLTVDDGYLKSSDKIQVTVNDVPPIATFAGGGPVPIGSAGAVSFTGVSDVSPAVQAAGFTYSYDFNNDGTFEVAASASPTVTVPASYLSAPGLHTIHGRVTDTNGGFADYTTTINVLSPVNQPPITQPDFENTFRNIALTFPVANILAHDLPGPPNESNQTLNVIAVTATSATHGTVVLNGDGTITYTPATGYSGQASFNYTVQDNGTSNGLPDPKSATDVVNVTVTARPPAAIPLAGPNAKAGTAVTFDGSTSTNPDGAPLTYAWTFGDGGGATGVSPTHVFTDPGDYTVTLTVADGLFLVTGSLSLVVADVPPTATFNGGGAVTLGQSGVVNFSNVTDISPAVTAAGFSYSYDFNNDGVFELLNSSSPTATVPASALATAGLHTIHGRVTDTNGGFTDYTTTINVTPASTGGPFVFTDTTTQGNWKGVYGSDGYNIAGDAAQAPSYAQLTFAGQSAWTWNADSSTTPSLQRAGVGRIAGTYYAANSFTADVNIIDGKTHQVALYFLDYDALGRNETVQMLDAGTGAILDTRSVSGFAGGKYLVYNVTGHVQFRITNGPGSINAVMAGIFFGGAQATPPSTGDPFVATDTATQGNWKGVYGSDGYNIAGDASQVPSYAQVSFSGQSAWTWNADSSTTPSLQRAGAGRIAGTYYAANSFTTDVNIIDGKTHQLALYFLDYDSLGRNETVQVVDTATGAILDTRSVSGFAGGKYLVYNVTGHIQFRITNGPGSINAVMAGIFFGGAQATPPPPTGGFVAVDSNTQGSWKGIYGADGYNVVDDSIQYPSYAQVGITGQSDWVWSQDNSDPRNLQRGSAGRIAGTYYAQNSFTLDVNIIDGKTHQLALYFLDWDTTTRNETVQMLDAVTGAVLDTRSVSDFAGGKYLVYNVAGHVQFRIANGPGSLNAVLSGIFFGPST